MTGEYERLRASRVARNRAKLQELGFNGLRKKEKRQPAVVKKTRVPVVERRQPAKKTTTTAPVERRRSARLKEPKNYTELPLQLPYWTNDSARVVVNDTEEYKPIIRRVQPGARYERLPEIELDQRWASKELSSMELDIDLSRVHPKWLGRQILPVGKVPIMWGMCAAMYTYPKFSRMSGVQQWRNAVVLFINIDSSDVYDNTFTMTPDGQVYVDWFAQERHHEHSPVIKRLVRGEDTILLFGRIVNMPYVYFGELAYEDHRVTETPIRFRFRLNQAQCFNWDHIQHDFGTHVLRRPE